MRPDVVANFDVRMGLMPLSGEPERWIWTFLCPVDTCECRDAVMLSHPDEARLRTVGEAVAKAWVEGEAYVDVARGLPQDVAVFIVDLETYQFFDSSGSTLLDLKLHPEARELSERVDGRILDELGRLWYLGKGLDPPPFPTANGKEKIRLDGWLPGDVVAWEEVFPSTFRDGFVFNRQAYEAMELYCVDRDCPCTRTLVEFRPFAPDRTPRPGYVELDDGDVVLHVARDERQLLSDLWEAYSARHRNDPDRHTRRRATLRKLGHRFAPARQVITRRAAPKIGRNSPCPCGSGKKYKKCCAVST